MWFRNERTTRVMATAIGTITIGETLEGVMVREMEGMLILGS